MGFSRLSINARLVAAFAIVVAILVALITVATISQGKEAAAQQLNIHTHEVIEQANGLSDAVVNMETGVRGFLITGLDVFLEPMTAGRKAFDARLAKVAELTTDERVKSRLAVLHQAHQEWLTQSAEPAIGLRREVITGNATMADVVAFEREARGKKVMDAMRSTLKEIQDIEQELLATRAATAEGAREFSSMVLIGGGAVAVVLSIILAIAIARSIVNPLRQVLRATEDLRAGDGDLTFQLPPMDAEFGEIATSLNGFIGKLHQIIATTKSLSASMSSGSLEIARGNDDLSQRTQEQAAALEETASSMEEMTATVKQNADNARQASQLAIGARDQADRGGTVVSRAVTAMGEISDSSRRIADIIDVIDEIAFQTNLLALNAAVEAARAGEQGRGFAVVATEVRNLAQRSATAAKEIKDLIGDSVSKVKAGTELVDQSGKSLTDIVASVKRVADIVAEISAASEEQASGIDQVNTAVTQMDSTTQQNAALVEEAAAASKGMEQQAQMLVEHMSFFAVSGGGMEPAAAASHATPAASGQRSNIRRMVRPTSKTAKHAQPARAGKPAPLAKVSGGDNWQEF